jgi:hypothetical protein
LQLESFNPFVNKFISSPIEAIREWLEWSKDHEEQLKSWFKYYLNTFNYVAEKEKLLKVQFAVF